MSNVDELEAAEALETLETLETLLPTNEDVPAEEPVAEPVEAPEIEAKAESEPEPEPLKVSLQIEGILTPVYAQDNKWQCPSCDYFVDIPTSGDARMIKNVRSRFSHHGQAKHTAKKYSGVVERAPEKNNDKVKKAPVKVAKTRSGRKTKAPTRAPVQIVKGRKRKGMRSKRRA